jgi:hypothetical protein
MNSMRKTTIKSAEALHYSTAEVGDPYRYFQRCPARERPGAKLTTVRADATCKKCLMAIANRWSWAVLTDAQRALLTRGAS